MEQNNKNNFLVNHQAEKCVRRWFVVLSWWRKKQNSKMEVHWQRYSRSSALFLSHAVCLSSVVYARNERCVASVCVCTCIGLCSLVLCWNVVKRMKQGSIKFYSATVEYIELLIGFVYIPNGSTWRKRIRFL